MAYMVIYYQYEALENHWLLTMDINLFQSVLYLK